MRIVQLAPADVRHGAACFSGGHVVFIARDMGSGLMRGRLVVSVLRQSFARHGVNASFFSANGVPQVKVLEDHLEAHGVVEGGSRPAACVVVKYGIAWVDEVHAATHR